MFYMLLYRQDKGLTFK